MTLKRLKKTFIKFPYLYILMSNHFNFKRTFNYIKGYKIIGKKELFNEEFYLESTKNISEFKTKPLLHYLCYGGFENRDPNPDFSSYYYLKKYKDVRKSKLNPLIHYVLYGQGENRLINQEQDNSQKKDQIIAKNKERIKLVEFDENSPLISIMILNRNGLNHLKRLFKNFKENIQYPNYEVIVVDNASCDESVQFLENIEDIPIKILKNKVNESFSKANNIGVEHSNGEFIVLLNNDIETTYGWLNEMMQTSIKNKHQGAVGAKLVYPCISTECMGNSYRNKNKKTGKNSYTKKSKSNKNNNNKKESFKIQHIGIAFTESSNGIMAAYNVGNKLKPFNKKANVEAIRGGVTAAALLIKKAIFKEVGGLDEDYNYGYEDVDFCLKLIKNGYNNVYCPNSLLFHYEHGTDESMNKTLKRSYRASFNKTVLAYKWNEYLTESVMNEKLNNERVLCEKPLELLFIVSQDNENLSHLIDSLNNYGWKASTLKSSEKNMYKINKNVDILISTIPNYYPREIAISKRNLIKFGLILDSPDEWAKNPAIGEYDSLLAHEDEILNVLMENAVESNLIRLKDKEFITFIKHHVPILIKNILIKDKNS